MFGLNPLNLIFAYLPLQLDRVKGFAAYLADLFISLVCIYIDYH